MAASPSTTERGRAGTGGRRREREGKGKPGDGEEKDTAGGESEGGETDGGRGKAMRQTSDYNLRYNENEKCNCC